MKKLFPLLMFFSIAILAACAPFHPSDHRAGVCNELNSQIIFNGNTSNTRQSEIENAETPLAQRAYDKRCT